jgi:hypothetical protein
MAWSLDAAILSVITRHEKNASRIHDVVRRFREFVAIGRILMKLVEHGLADAWDGSKTAVGADYCTVLPVQL